jgi:hypothetical protein
MEESKDIINNQLQKLEQEKISLEEKNNKEQQYEVSNDDISTIKRKTLLTNDDDISELLTAHKGNIKNAINDYYTYKLNILLDECDFNDANKIVNMLKECKGDENIVRTKYFDEKLAILKKQIVVDTNDDGLRLLKKHYGSVENAVLDSYGVAVESKKRTNNMAGKSFFNPDELNKLFSKFDMTGQNDVNNTTNTDTTNDNNNNETNNNTNNNISVSNNIEKSGSDNNNETNLDNDNILKFNEYKNIFNNNSIMSFCEQYNSYSYIILDSYASNYTKRKTYNSIKNILETQHKLNETDGLQLEENKKQEYITNKHNDLILIKLYDSVFTSFLNCTNIVVTLFQQQVMNTANVKEQDYLASVNQNATKLLRQYNYIQNNQCVIGKCIIIDNFIYE